MSKIGAVITVNKGSDFNQAKVLDVIFFLFVQKLYITGLVILAKAGIRIKSFLINKRV